MHEIVQGISLDSSHNNNDNNITLSSMTKLLLYYLDKGEDFTWAHLGIHARDIPCTPHHIYHINNNSSLSMDLGHPPPPDCIKSLDNGNCGFGSEAKYGCLYFQLTWANIALVTTGMMLALAMTLAIAVLFSTTALVTKTLIYSIARAITTTTAASSIIQPATLLFYLIFYYVLLHRHEPDNSQHSQPKTNVQFHHLTNYTSKRWLYIGIMLLFVIFTTMAALLDPVEHLTIQQTAKRIARDHILCILVVTLVLSISS
jgi:hypothetical protein